jgi:ketosteroid isomerase-like protein
MTKACPIGSMNLAILQRASGRGALAVELFRKWGLTWGEGESASREAPEHQDLVLDAYRLRLDSSDSELTAQSIDRFLQLLAPDAVFVGELGAVHGRGAIGRFLQETSEQWQDYGFVVEECLQIDAQRVLASGTVIARPTDVPALYEIPFANVWTIEGGLATRVESFADRQRAELALGRTPGD